MDQHSADLVGNFSGLYEIALSQDEHIGRSTGLRRNADIVRSQDMNEICARDVGISHVISDTSLWAGYNWLSP